MAIRVVDTFSVPNPLFGDVAISTDGDNNVRFIDTKTVLSKLAALDGESSRIRALFDASHSGTVVNGRMYPARELKKNLSEWMSPYSKPLLRGHPSHWGGEEVEPLGRCFQSKFEPLVEGWAKDFTWEEPEIRGVGSGRILLGFSIDDMDAFQKLQDRRYITVSTGHYIDHLTCSICGIDWVTGDERCQHYPGEYYEVAQEEGAKKRKKKLCFLLASGMHPDHLAIVNTPAQPHAHLLEITELGGDGDDSVETLLLRMSTDTASGSLEIVLDNKERFLSTAYDTRGWKPDTITFMVSDKETSMEGQETAETTATETETLETTAVVVEPTITPVTPTPSVEDSVEVVTLDGPTFAKSIVLASIIDQDKPEDLIDWAGFGMTLVEAEEHVARLDLVPVPKEITSHLFSETEVPEILDADARSKIDVSCYCGPDKTFPIVSIDCATFAKTLLRHYKGDGDKVKIMAAINRVSKNLSKPETTESVDSAPALVQFLKECQSALVEGLTDKKIEFDKNTDIKVLIQTALCNIKQIETLSEPSEEAADSQDTPGAESKVTPVENQSTVVNTSRDVATHRLVDNFA